MSALSFDPDRYLASRGNVVPLVPPAPLAPIAIETPPPLEWRQGQVRLADMPRPAFASEGRWAQILHDCDRLIFAHHEAATAAGWATPQLFGFDANDPTGQFGLVLHLRGRRLLGFDTDALGRSYATIRAARGWRYVYRHATGNGAPIWEMGRPRR